MGNNYFPGTYLLLNKYSLQEEITPLEIVWSVEFSHLNTPRRSIFLRNMYSLVKLLYWNKPKILLKGVPLNRFLKSKQNHWIFSKDYAKIESFFSYFFGNSGTVIFKEYLSLLNNQSNIFQPRFIFWLMINVRKMLSNKHVDLRKTENFVRRKCYPKNISKI